MDSFWLNSLEEWERDTTTIDSILQSDILYDTVIIGGGISGLSTAYHLTAKGKQCIVLEKGRLCSGATGTNGGIIQTSITSLKGNTEKYGLETAINLLKYSDLCIQEIKDVVDTLQIECELRFNGYLVAASSNSEFERLLEVYSFLNQHGIDCQWWSADDCKMRTRRNLFGGVFSSNGGNLWASKFVCGLAKWIIERGSCIATNTPAISVQSVGHQLIVSTIRGTFRCSNVVYACNAWSRGILPDLEKIIIPVRNQVITTLPLQPIWPFTIVTNSGYEYMMQRPDGRIILGGMRNISQTMEYNSDNTTDLNPLMSEKLSSYLSEHFSLVSNRPEEPLIEREWIGIMGFTPDHQPLVGRLTDRPGEYILAGYSGHGMPVAFLSGKLIASMICDEFEGIIEEYPWIETVLNQVYTPSRYGL